MKKILVLSGGGVRGYAQAQVLKKLEMDNGLLYTIYDLIVGSSVGAINGAMVASGKISMNKLESIYPDMAKKIFQKSWWPFKVPKYDRKNFINIFMDEVGMIKMKECKTKLQISTVSLCDKRNYFFKSWEDKDADSYLVSQVCKSFAAPYYFGAFVDESSKQVYFDGGMGIANVPVMYSFIESFLLWPNEECQFDVIGCGYSNAQVSFEEAKKYKTFKQLSEFFEIDDGGLAREQVRQEQIGALTVLCKSSPRFSMNYYDIEIPKEMDVLDGIKYLNDYKKYGEQMAKQPLITF